MEASHPTPALPRWLPASVPVTGLPRLPVDPATLPDNSHDELANAEHRARASMDCEELGSLLAECHEPLMAALRTRNAELVGRVVLAVVEAHITNVSEREVYGSPVTKREPAVVAAKAMDSTCPKTGLPVQSSALLRDALLLVRKVSCMPEAHWAVEGWHSMYALREEASGIKARANLGGVVL